MTSDGSDLFDATSDNVEEALWIYTGVKIREYVAGALWLEVYINLRDMIDETMIPEFMMNHLNEHSFRETERIADR